MEVFIIGLTGGISCGKSTVSERLQQLGAVIIDGDKIAKAVTDKVNVLKELTLIFGDKIINPDNTLNRKELGNMVFGNKEALEKLNSVIHPKVEQEIKLSIQHYINSGFKGVVILDIPLLIEINLQERINLDELWLVSINKEIQLKRLMLRNGLTEKEATARINSQLSLEEKSKFADLIIDNSFDLGYLYGQIDENYNRLMNILN